MFRYYIKTALKNIFAKKSNAWINILGLALGLSITLLIWNHVLFERSYDRFFEDYQQVYRVHNTLVVPGDDPIKIPTSMFGLGASARDRFPEVVQMTRFNDFFRNPSLRHNDKIVNTPLVAATDSTFFDVFSMEFLAGEAATALTAPNSIVLTQSLAQKLFDTPVMGMHQVIELNNIKFHVTGIIQDMPENSHMTFNGLISTQFLPEGMRVAAFLFHTYLKLSHGADINKLEAGLSDLSSEVLLTNPFISMDEFPVKVNLAPLADIHLTSSLLYEMKNNGSQRNVRIFSGLSIFVLLLAMINYINMATARSSLRAKEIGLRKVAGSSRAALIRQFMIESFIVTSIAFALALLMAENFSGFFSQRLGISIDPRLMLSGMGLTTLVVLFVFTAITAGLYPALYLSSFNPVKILKGEMVKGKKGQLFRRLLVVFQFSITIFLVSSLLVISMQMNFILNQNLGYDKESVIIARDISLPMRRNFADVVNRLENINGVKQVTGADFLFGENNPMEIVSYIGASDEKGVLADLLGVDHNFIQMMDMKIVEGRNFYPHSDMDAGGAFILNQAAIRALGIEDPLQTRMNIFGEPRPVIGVVQDFRLKSMHQSIDPVVFYYINKGYSQLLLKLEPGNISKMREQISEVLLEFDPAWLPDLVFLDEKLEAQYSGEKQSANLLWSGSLLAIIISMLGVYGLAAFAIERRIKEIGIRKVLGASAGNLLWVFNREFSMLVLVAFVIAAPLAWWIMNGWLNNFSEQVKLNPVIFLLPALITFLLTTVIISTQVYLTGRANPVVSLKTE